MVLTFLIFFCQTVVVKPLAQLSPSFFLFIFLYIPNRPNYLFAHYPEHNLDIEKCLVAFQTWFNDFKYMQIIHANNISCSRKIETRWVNKDWFRNNMNNCTPIFVKKQLKKYQLCTAWGTCPPYATQSKAKFEWKTHFLNLLTSTRA